MRWSGICRGECPPPPVLTSCTTPTRSRRSLDAVIKETLRVHSTSSLGLPRQVPPTTPGGVDICGRHFPAGTVLSVPSCKRALYPLPTDPPDRPQIRSTTRPPSGAPTPTPSTPAAGPRGA